MSDDNGLPGPLQVRLLDLMWEQGPLTVQQMHDTINAASIRKLAYTTVLTVARNLAKRGLCTQVASGRRHVFTPTCTRQQMQQHALRHMLGLLFGGSSAELMKQLQAINQTSAVAAGGQ